METSQINHVVLSFILKYLHINVAVYGWIMVNYFQLFMQESLNMEMVKYGHVINVLMVSNVKHL